jgi:hypothetical protein
MNIIKINKNNNEMKYGWMNVEDIKTDPQFFIRQKNEEKLKKIDKYKNKKPIECLEINGYDILCDETNEKIVVCIDRSYDLYEGVYRPRLENIPDDNFYYIPKKSIKDYNSLWELTNTGWDSGKPKLYPYIFIKEKSETKFSMWRWDNSNFVRVNCLTHNWDKKNYDKFYRSEEYKELSSNNPKSLIKKNQFTELGRNEKCWCGSDEKYKRCCMNKPQTNNYDCDIVIESYN